MQKKQLKMMQSEMKISIENLGKNIGNQIKTVSDSTYKQLTHLSDTLSKSLELFQNSINKQWIINTF